MAEGEYKGWVELSVQESLLSSKVIVANVSDVMGIASLGNDDLGIDDTEANIISVDNYIDVVTGETVERGPGWRWLC